MTPYEKGLPKPCIKCNILLLSKPGFGKPVLAAAYCFCFDHCFNGINISEVVSKYFIEKSLG
jgi:hypothetical protein